VTKMEDFGQKLFVEQKKLAEHFKEVRSFHAYREQTRKRLSQVMMVITGIALLGNLAQAWTIAALVPLARIVPVYFWVRNDGTIDSSVSTSQLPPTQSAAVVNAALWQYVRLREGYAYDTAQYAYDVVSAFSAPTVAEQYQKWFNYPNPESPQVTIGNRGTITISHISSYDIGPSLQQIRFERVVTIAGHTPIVTTMTATIGYTMAGKLPANTRLDDPGGVLVTSYQSSEDTPK
jgi:type IV secretion system protein VirB8